MSRPRLLDLFCSAGGCAMGYHRAGFDVTGIDIKPQKRYPFAFVQADALEYVAAHGHEFDAIHASPPCQRYSLASFTTANRSRHADLLPVARTWLQRSGKPYIIENVPGSPIRQGVELCGLMFGLKVFRHRWFESSHLMMVPAHPSHRGKRIGIGGMRNPIGHGGWASSRQRSTLASSAERDDKASWISAMGIDWMTRNELAQAIPPAYTEYLGRQLLAAIQNVKE